MGAYSTLLGVGHTFYSNLFVTLPVPKGSLRGQTVIVTGGNTGLGFETAKHCILLGAESIILAVRTVSKGEAAKQELQDLPKEARQAIEVWELDLDSYDSVEKFANRASQLGRLDAILENAGISMDKFSKSEEDERTITVNVVSTFLLAFLLLPKMRDSARKFNTIPRIVIVGSAGHFWAPLAEFESNAGIFATMNDKKIANMKDRYFVSKLMVAFIVREMGERLHASKQQPEVIVNNTNPSYCKSSLGLQPGQVRKGPEAFAENYIARSTEEGSRALVAGIMAGTESQGGYLSNCKVVSPAPTVTSKHGQKIQKKIWEELMVKLETIQPGVSNNI
ncbi:MAG: hypothetical protein MMC33_002059 [Icmadophila ericetorum]|nr:hypothetical protein [Icmadophila ericetorum]